MPDHNATTRFDVLIVGGGSTGAVLASRLSAHDGCQVLLLEAGPEKPINAAIMNAVRNANQPAVAPGLNWKIRTLIKGETPRQAQVAAVGSQSAMRPSASPVRSVATVFDYEAGKILGGSSAVNAVQALRGVPDDFAEWAVECGQEWSWQAVLPYFRMLEDDPAGPGTLHGRGGPMPIRRESKAELRPLQTALRDACIALGFPETEDHNDPATTGVGVIPKNVVNGIRMSTASTYLASARGRTGLTIVTGAHVHRLLWSAAGACDGVEAQIDGEPRRFLAREVIVCAGAMNTPALLMRSGIGSPALLEPLGIKVRVPLTGVGEGLMDHPVVGIWGIPKPDACVIGEPLRQTLLRYTSNGSAVANDMHICMVAGVDAHELFPQLAASTGASVLAGITTCFNRSTSRGHVRISSADPHAPLQVNMNCLGQKSDLAPLKEGVRLAWRLLQHPALQSRFDQILAWTSGLVSSDVALERAVTTFVRPSAHVCCTARMGQSPDNGAVTDAHGRVYGTENLRVADASIMPRIPSAPTHLTSLMIAEKLAADFHRK